MSAMAAVKGGEIRGRSTTASTARSSHFGRPPRRAVGPVADEAAHGIEARALVPEHEDEQAPERVEHEEENGRPHHHGGGKDDGVPDGLAVHGAAQSLMTSLIQRSTRRLRFFPTHSRSTGRSFASFMSAWTSASMLAPGRVGSM